MERAPQRGAARNESAIQQLFEEAPWLIDPLFHDYLTADKSLNSTIKLLAAALGVANPTTPEEIAGVLSREPDFVFLLGDDPLHYVVIVELKASTKPAEVSDIMQLREYMDTARNWLDSNGHPQVKVLGAFICSPPSSASNVRGERYFTIESNRLTASDNHRVRSYSRVLDDTEMAHAFLLKLSQQLAGSEEPV